MKEIKTFIGHRISVLKRQPQILRFIVYIVRLYYLKLCSQTDQ